MPVADRQYKRTLQGATLSRTERIVETICEPDDDDAACTKRGEEAARKRFPDAHSVTVEIEQPGDDAPEAPKRAYSDVIVDPGMKSVIEELRMAMVVDGAGAELETKLKARAERAGLTLSKLESLNQRTTVILSCSKYQKNVAPDD